LKRVAWLICAALLCPIAEAATEYYDTEYRLDFHPEQHVISVEIRLKGDELPSRLKFKLDGDRYRNFTSTDTLQKSASEVEWVPRGKFSRLQYDFVVDHQRKPRGYDSLMTDQWALFRGEKLVPRVAVTAKKKLHARATLSATLPKGWSFVTPYGSAGDKSIKFNNAHRRFDRPEGWMLAGEIGTRSEIITGIQTIVAAPTGDNARRQDTLAFLNWNLPKLLEIFPQFPRRVLIVYAGDPMWRGGLSGPNSIYLHADRPLISENRTSTLLHELVHIALGIHGDEESDWIVEGMAEYYSLEILRRSGSIDQQRYEESLRSLGKWARRSPSLFVPNSAGATTARAVIAFKQADDEIRAASHGKASLDDVARQLAATGGEVTLQALQSAADRAAGKSVAALSRERLMSGPPSIAQAQ
jgi:predicted metalloprotease with PDZ domain